MSHGMSTNVSISSLLDSNSSSTNTNVPSLKKLQGKGSDIKQVHTPIQQLVSQFQTSFDPTVKSNNGAVASNNTITLGNNIPKPKANVIVGADSSKSRSLSYSPPPSISAQVKKFQTKFQLEPVASPQPKSKTSINSIINMDDEELAPTPPIPSQSTDVRNQNVLKRKKPSGTVKPNDTKKRKSGTPDLQQPPSIVSKSNISREDNTANTSKNETKKPPQTGMNTIKAPTKPVKLAGPTVIDLLNPDDGEDITSTASPISSPATSKTDKAKEKLIEKTPREKEKEKERAEPPIVALNIPLLDPKDPQPGKAEVVVNVLKLAEDKYGWSVMHPKAKSAIEVIDDMIDDEDDDEDDDDVGDDQEKAPQQSNNSVLPIAPRGKELTEEQLVRQHEIKMIRKVGKYDFEDPFIDDVELQIEEDISSTKEGFFVYWGPLVDDRSSNKKGFKKK
ncbi:HPC2 and ubinuclein domain family protein [Candida parapsilosis]|uniref:HUN domain-containing protein n=2 Tax=Candida parapsilosis TaxID=5480 RepID=G8BFM1_CANPC|nr:uncharacterized protein CPAR2_202980 [Candida parapsilosis]KAF6055195.1 HPC2 and ubinuclein domain family protein [Candida parapsilosis]KAF6055782.1 HPC2 and ubinuclein domain family protein [Candida parapsilosis]KAF6058712.1 HPC2 and ubinuclein domain family protein [Candida parapsilosis]KAF6067469.1 HPC2 and ubinuclein domain family protein [Candida parapsilosis]KAI5901377.1 Histone promoter control protein 2 [Candida parapsilosis]